MCQLGPGLHPSQGVGGCLDSASFLFTTSQENRDLAVIGMTFQESVQIAHGDPERPLTISSSIAMIAAR